MNETTIMTDVLRGDVDRYAELVERYQIGLVIHCERLVGSRDDAEDCAQQAFIKAYQHLKDFDIERGRFSTWLYRIATNVCTDMLRRQKRMVNTDDMDAFAEAFTPDVFRTEAIREVRDAVRDLVPPEQQQTIVAYYWEGKSYQQIADEMHVPINTVKSWLRRAKIQLKGALS